MAVKEILHLSGHLKCTSEAGDKCVDGAEFDAVYLDGKEQLATDPYHFYYGRIGDLGYGEWHSAGELVANMVAKLQKKGHEVKVTRKRGVWHFTNWHNMPFEEKKK